MDMADIEHLLNSRTHANLRRKLHAQEREREKEKDNHRQENKKSPIEAVLRNIKNLSKDLDEANCHAFASHLLNAISEFESRNYQ